MSNKKIITFIPKNSNKVKEKSNIKKENKSSEELKDNQNSSKVYDDKGNIIGKLDGDKIEEERQKELDSDKNFRPMLRDIFNKAKELGFSLMECVEMMSIDFKDEDSVESCLEKVNKKFNIILSMLNEKYNNYEFLIEQTGSEYCFLGFNSYIHYLSVRKKKNNEKDYKEYPWTTLVRIELNATIKEGGNTGHDDLIQLMKFMNKQSKNQITPKLLTYESKYQKKIDENGNEVPKSFKYYTFPISINQSNLKEKIISENTYFPIVSFLETINDAYDKNINNIKEILNENNEGKIMIEPHNFDSYYLSEHHIIILIEYLINGFRDEFLKDYKINKNKSNFYRIMENDYFKIINDRSKIDNENNFIFKEINKDLDNREYFEKFCDYINDKMTKKVNSIINGLFDIGKNFNEENIKFINIKFVDHDDMEDECDELISNLKIGLDLNNNKKDNNDNKK